MIQRRQFLAGSCVGAFGLPGIAFAQNGYKSEYRPLELYVNQRWVALT